MKLNTKDFRVEQIIRKKFLKIELKKKVLKSILRSRIEKNSCRINAAIQLFKFKKKSLAFLHQNLCFVTSKKKSNFNLFNLSRQSFKRHLLFNKVQNCKVKAW